MQFNAINAIICGMQELTIRCERVRTLRCSGADLSLTQDVCQGPSKGDHARARLLHLRRRRHLHSFFIIYQHLKKWFFSVLLQYRT